MTERNTNPDAIPPPACGLTIELLQRILDGESPAAALDADPHPSLCAACRERIAIARLVQKTLTVPATPSVPSRLTDSILTAVSEDRYARIRRRSYTIAVGMAAALAASVFLFGWLNKRPSEIRLQSDMPSVPPGFARAQPQPPSAPEPHAVRLGDEFSKVGQALLDTSKPLTEPASKAPSVLGIISHSLTRPDEPTAAFEPATNALAELPDAARASLEPVTSTTQKAFARLLRDMGGIQVTAKP
jgi:hypothetical protein